MTSSPPADDKGRNLSRPADPSPSDATSSPLPPKLSKPHRPEPTPPTIRQRWSNRVYATITGLNQSKVFQRCCREVALTFGSTVTHARHFGQFVLRALKTWKAKADLGRARFQLGERMYQLGMGDRDLVQKIAILTGQIETAGRKVGNLTARRQRRHLVLRLADVTLAGDAPPAEAAVEFSAAVEARAVAEAGKAAAKQCLTGLVLPDLYSRLRVAAGYCTIVVVGLVVIIWMLPRGHRSAASSSGMATMSQKGTTTTALRGNTVIVPKEKQVKRGSTVATQKTVAPVSFEVPDLFKETKAAGYPPVRLASVVARFVAAHPDSAHGRHKISQGVFWEPSWKHHADEIVFKCSVPFRLHMPTADPGARSDELTGAVFSIAVLRANMQDTWFLTKEKTLRPCRTPQELAFVEKHDGIIYVGESNESQVLLHCCPEEPTLQDIKASVSRIARDYRMDVVFENLRYEEMHDCGYYLRSALIENNGDSERVVDWNATGLVVNDSVPHYFRVDPQRRPQVVSANLVAVALVHVPTGNIVAAYQRR